MRVFHYIVQSALGGPATTYSVVKRSHGVSPSVKRLLSDFVGEQLKKEMIRSEASKIKLNDKITIIYDKNVFKSGNKAVRHLAEFGKGNFVTTCNI